MSNYYNQTFFIPRVNNKGKIIGKIERWQAHKNGILHYGFTVALYHKGLLICQHRKHPVFNGVIDLTASSHPLFIKNQPQEDTVSISQTLQREWKIEKEDLRSPLKLKGKISYKAADYKYIENEICSLYIAEINKLPHPNFDFAYGFSLFTPSELKSTKHPFTKILAPWVKQFIKAGLI